MAETEKKLAETRALAVVAGEMALGALRMAQDDPLRADDTPEKRLARADYYLGWQLDAIGFEERVAGTRVG